MFRLLVSTAPHNELNKSRQLSAATTCKNVENGKIKVESGLSKGTHVALEKLLRRPSRRSSSLCD
jgi:hypothetical protein